MTFVHLHVASGFSLRHGVSTPQALVERAVQLGLPALALTDRDGLYGAVRFARACEQAGLGVVLGVDLAVHPSPGSPTVGGNLHPRRTAARGGVLVDPRHPRVTVLARGSSNGGSAPGAGYARLCRLVTATHLRGERGAPVTTPDLLAEHALDPATGAGALVVLLGPGSDVGRAVLRRHHARARELLQAWKQNLPAGCLAMEIVCHDGPAGTVGCRAQAQAMARLAQHEAIPSVLTAQVRYAEPGGAATADVLDAARRLVALDTRHLDRVTTSGYLASAEEMARTARRVVGEQADGLLERTAALAVDCLQDPRTDLGIGSVQLPETDALGLAPGQVPQIELAARCRAGMQRCYPGADEAARRRVLDRLDDELQVIADLGYASYFLTVAVVCDLIRDMGARVAARGSGAGSLVNHLLGISGIDPMQHGLLMERFCTTLRAQLPDIDIDVESDRRTAIYERILDHFGGDRVTCVSMMDSYRVRHAVRDVGAALGMPPAEVDAIAKAFPHLRARDARNAIAELPELRRSGLDASRLATFFELVERLDGLPRHIALHPCGVVLSNRRLLDRTPVEASWLGLPMSHYDKDDVEAMGFLKLDVLGIRMQSAMAYAVAEVERVDGQRIDLDDRSQVPLDDERTFRLVRSTHTLGCFQIESPGQRELIGKFGPRTFEDIIVDISLFRPGPVKSDMITPFLRARHGWAPPQYLHPTLVDALEETAGVVVFHEQVLKIVATTTGCSLAQADEVRRAMGSAEGQERVESWWRPAAAARGYSPADLDRIWEVLRSFASFGFCKAHAAAFALPTYQSAWLKAHHPAAFLAGVLTHDPGMYPKRLILDDARSLGISVLGLDINASGSTYRVERLAQHTTPGHRPAHPVHPDLPDGSGYGIRLSLADVASISEAEVQRIIAGRPYASMPDLWARARPTRPVLERLVLAGALDSLYGIDAGTEAGAPAGRHGRVTRRDLLLHVAELERYDRAVTARRPTTRSRRTMSAPLASSRDSTPPGSASRDVRAAAARQSRAPVAAAPAEDRSVQLAFDLGDAPELTPGSGLPEMSAPEKVRAELDVLGLDASRHVITAYDPLLDALGVVRACRLLDQRSRREILVAGVKVATQTPPVRSGRRVVFVTLDDSTGPVDATLFEDVQDPYATTVFHSWLLVVRGGVRRTGPRGVSLRATGAWELGSLWDLWRTAGIEAVLDEITPRPVADVVGVGIGGSARRVLVHPSGFAQSPYADIAPAGGSTRQGRGLADVVDPTARPGAGPRPGTGAITERAVGAVEGTVSPPRKLWHASPGSAGH